MCMAGIKWGPYPSTIHSFSNNLNEEAILKVSFKNIDKFQSCLFSKTSFFSKRALKVQNFLKNQNFFFISGWNFIVLFNGILFVLILSVVIEAQKETLLSRFNWPPLQVMRYAKKQRQQEQLFLCFLVPVFKLFYST